MNSWNYLYLTVDLACVSIPFIASFYPKYPFYKEWKYFLPANVLVGVFFLVWDELFTQMGVWGFNPSYLLGIKIGHLPIEEILFFFCIPYACVFTFYALTKLWPTSTISHHRSNQKILSVFAFLCMAIGVYFVDRWYTSTTFLFLGLYFVIHAVKGSSLKYHFMTYFLIYGFFLLSNGILTGSWIEDQVVWYNDHENLGIRLGTIPLEDSFYGMLLIFMNIDFMLFFKNKAKD